MTIFYQTKNIDQNDKLINVVFMLMKKIPLIHVFAVVFHIVHIVEVYCKIFIVIFRKKERIITEKLISNRSSFQATIFSHILNALNLLFTQTFCTGL